MSRMMLGVGLILACGFACAVKKAAQQRLCDSYRGQVDEDTWTGVCEGKQ